MKKVVDVSVSTDPIEDYQNIVCENSIKSLLDNYDKEGKPNASK